MKRKNVEIFWDIGSTNAYFALHLIKPILKRTNSSLILHPYNLGFDPAYMYAPNQGIRWNFGFRFRVNKLKD